MARHVADGVEYLACRRSHRMFVYAIVAVMAATTRSRTASALANAPRLGLGMASLGRPGYINLGHAADLPDDRDSVEAMKPRAAFSRSEIFYK